MTNEDILDEIDYCDLAKSKELSPGEAYLFKNYFGYECDLLVFVKDGIKVGGIYRMGNWDMHIIIREEYRNQHILSNFLKKGIIKKIWPKIKAVDLCDIDSQDTFEKKKYLVGLCNMTIRNEKTILETVEKFGWPRDTYLSDDFDSDEFILKKDKEGVPMSEVFRYLNGYLEKHPA